MRKGVKDSNYNYLKKKNTEFNKYGFTLEK
jgi:hypothetical protein